MDLQIESVDLEMGKFEFPNASLRVYGITNSISGVMYL